MLAELCALSGEFPPLCAKIAEDATTMTRIIPVRKLVRIFIFDPQGPKTEPPIDGILSEL
jgi:hypothetical protein